MATETEIFSVISLTLNDGFERYNHELWSVLHKQKTEKWQSVRIIDLPKAFRGTKNIEKAFRTFEGTLGVKTERTLYGSAEGRWNEHALVTAYDTELAKETAPEVTRLAAHNAIRMAFNSELVGGKLIYVGGYIDHLQDSVAGNPSLTEASRSARENMFFEEIKPEGNTLLAFDFNAMPEASVGAKIARLLGKVGGRYHPESIQLDPKTAFSSFPEKMFGKLFGLSALSIRATMDEFIPPGFVSADKHALFPANTVINPIAPLGPTIAIDGIFHSPGLKLVDFGTFRGPSDHPGLAATFEVERIAA